MNLCSSSKEDWRMDKYYSVLSCLLCQQHLLIFSALGLFVCYIFQQYWGCWLQLQLRGGDISEAKNRKRVFYAGVKCWIFCNRLQLSHCLLHLQIRCWWIQQFISLFLPSKSFNLIFFPWATGIWPLNHLVELQPNSNTESEYEIWIYNNLFWICALRFKGNQIRSEI